MSTESPSRSIHSRVPPGVLTALLCAAFASPALAGRIIVVNGDPVGVGMNDPTPAAAVAGNPGSTLGEQRLNVLLHAASIWEAELQPRVDIFVDARFVSLGFGVAASGGAIAVDSDFEGAEYAGMWYPVALANELRGFDAFPHDGTWDTTTGNNPTDEIALRVATGVSFYLGFDGNEPLGTVDLLPWALHELAHGLGFENFVNEASGQQFLGMPDIFSQYTLDVTTNKHWNEMTDAERAASAINIRSVVWNGVHVNGALRGVLSGGSPNLRVNAPPLGNMLLGSASFGPPLASPGTTGDVALVADAVAAPSLTDACEPITNVIAGKIALIDRGACAFTVKVKNAQDAGAIAALIVDNVPQSPPAGLGGEDATITIPSGRVTLADGDTLKANLAAGVNVTLEVDLSILAGTDRTQGKMLLATFYPVRLGFSIVHFDDIAFPNQLMEPAIAADVGSSVTPPNDLTAALLTDLGWHSDHDGVPDGADQCLDSDVRPIVMIGTCNTGAANDVLQDGCSLSDELAQCEAQLQSGPGPTGYLDCVASKTRAWRASETITRAEQKDIFTCAARRSGDQHQH